MEGPRACGIFYVCTSVGGCRTCIRGDHALCTTGTAASGTQELVSAHPMVHVSAHFAAPGPNYSDFGWPAGHGRANNAATENDFFGSKSKNSKTFMRLSKNKEDTTVSGHARALPFSSVFSTPARLEKCAGRALVNFFGPWTPKRAINRAFPRLRALFANFVRESNRRARKRASDGARPGAWRCRRGASRVGTDTARRPAACRVRERCCRRHSFRSATLWTCVGRP